MITAVFTSCGRFDLLQRTMSSSENMDKLCDLLTNFENIYNQIQPEAYAENYIGYWIGGHFQMPVISIDAPYDIYRGN